MSAVDVKASEIEHRTCDDCKYQECLITEPPCIFCRDLNLPPYALWTPKEGEEVKP